VTAWRDGATSALEIGLLHGAYCLGCCWLLFVILFPLGIMNVGAMAAVTLIIFTEKTLPWPRLAPYAAASVLVLYGALVITSPPTPSYLPARWRVGYARRNADDDARREVALFAPPVYPSGFFKVAQRRRDLHHGAFLKIRQLKPRKQTWSSAFAVAC
jgi:hypothetical protein